MAFLKSIMIESSPSLAYTCLCYIKTKCFAALIQNCSQNPYGKWSKPYEPLWQWNVFNREPLGKLPHQLCANLSHYMQPVSFIGIKITFDIYLVVTINPAANINDHIDWSSVFSICAELSFLQMLSFNQLSLSSNNFNLVIVLQL